MTADAAPSGGPESYFAGPAAGAPAGRSPDTFADRSPDHAIFQPIVDLDNGTVAAVGVVVPRWPVTDAWSDAEGAVHAARAAVRMRTPLPLRIGLRLPTLLDERAMSRLHMALTGIGRSPGGVIVSVAMDAGGPPPGDAAGALSWLRRAGYLLAVEDADALPARFVADVAPAVLTLGPEVARRAAADPRRAALAEALVALGRRTGGHVLAPGIVSDDQLARLRNLGVRLAEGPLLAPRDWRPGARVTVPIGAREDDRLGPRVTEFMLPATVMPDDATAGDVLSAFDAESAVTSVVLVDETQRPRYMIDRTRFLLRLAGAYGHALHARRPAVRLADPPRPVPRTVPAIAALRAAGDAAERVYDDLVVVDELGRCLGIARVADLIRALSDMDARAAAATPPPGGVPHAGPR